MEIFQFFLPGASTTTSTNNWVWKQEEEDETRAAAGLKRSIFQVARWMDVNYHSLFGNKVVVHHRHQCESASESLSSSTSIHSIRSVTIVSSKKKRLQETRIFKLKFRLRRIISTDIIINQREVLASWTRSSFVQEVNEHESRLQRTSTNYHHHLPIEVTLQSPWTNNLKTQTYQRIMELKVSYPESAMKNFEDLFLIFPPTSGMVRWHSTSGLRCHTVDHLSGCGLRTRSRHRSNRAFHIDRKGSTEWTCSGACRPATGVAQQMGRIRTGCALCHAKKWRCGWWRWPDKFQRETIQKSHSGQGGESIGICAHHQFRLST